MHHLDYPSRLVVAALLVTGLAGCADAGDPLTSDGQTRRTTIVDGPVWNDLESLAGSADAVLLGTVTGVAAREVDTGGTAGTDGVPMTFFTFRVERVLAGPRLASDEITLGWLDTVELQTLPATSELAPSQRLVVFADFLTDEQTPGLHSVGDIYVPLGFDLGVLDAPDGTATPRSPEVRSLRPRGPKAGEWTLAAITRVARESRAD